MTGEAAAGRGEASPEAAAHGAAGHGEDGPAEIRALAVTVSNRAAAGVYEDRSGPVLARLLAEAGCTVDGPLVVPDGIPGRGGPAGGDHRRLPRGGDHRGHRADPG